MKKCSLKNAIIYVFLCCSIAGPDANGTPWPQNLTVGIPSEIDIPLHDFTLTTYFSLGNDSKPRGKYSNYIREAEEETRRHYGNKEEKILACYYIQTTYRNALTDLRRYFWRRTLYRSTLEYEVGYLTHEVIWRYRVILELYKYLTDKYVTQPQANFASINIMFYLYTNAVEQGTVIIHLCNMLHELERKYRMPREQGVFDDYTNSRDPQKGGGNKPKHNMSAQEAALAEYQAYLKRLRAQARKKKKEEKERRKQILNLGKITTRGKAKPKKSRWPLHYGWSIEDW